MKLQGTLADISIDFKTKKPKITLLINSNMKTLEELDKLNLLDIEVKKHRNKRSLDANAYCWVLCEKLAIAMDTTKEEIYKHEIRQVGKSTIVPIKINEVDYFKNAWEDKGLGYICEDLGKSKLKNFENVRVYYGSSSYNTKDMARLIDSIVEDCKSVGIETLPPNELKSLIEGWKK